MESGGLGNSCPLSSREALSSRHAETLLGKVAGIIGNLSGLVPQERQWEYSIQKPFEYRLK
jgi:hypothetical protein